MLRTGTAVTVDPWGMSVTASGFRTAVIRLIAVSFSIAALLGIAVLLRGGQMGDLEGRILLTTLLVGVVSIAVLCYLTPRGRAQIVGAVGGGVVLVPLVTGLLMIWLDSEPFARVAEVFATGGLVAGLLAQICLLWSTAGDQRPEDGHRVLRSGLVATLVVAVLWVLEWMPAIWIEGFDPSEWYWRLVGVTAILDVLGTVLVPAFVMLRRVRVIRAESPHTDAWVDAREQEPNTTHGLPEDLWEEIEEIAVASGRPQDEVVREAVRRHREELVAAGAIHG